LTQGNAAAKGTSGIGFTGAGVHAIVTISNMDPNTKLDGYCATESLALTDKFSLETLPVVFTRQPKESTEATKKSVSFDLSIDTPDHINCVLTNPDEHPTAEQITDGLTSTGFAAIKQTGVVEVKQANQLVTFPLVGLTPGRAYWVWCAAKSGTRSEPLEFRTKGGIPQPTLVGQPYAPSFNITVTTPDSGLLRCVTVRPGRRPTPYDVLRGDASTDEEAQSAPSPIMATPNSPPYTIEFGNAHEFSSLDIYCANEAGSISPVLTVYIQEGRKCSTRTTCSACTNAGCYYAVNILSTNYQAGSCLDSCPSQDYDCAPNTLVCNDMACSYGPWGGWSSCSDPCSGGFRTRVRNLISGSQAGCELSEEEVEVCNQRQCRQPTITQLPDQEVAIHHDEDMRNATSNTFFNTMRFTTVRHLGTLTTRKQITLSGISSGGDPDQKIMVHASSDQPSIVRNPTVEYRDGNTNGVLSYEVPEYASGHARLTITVTDSGSRSTGPMSTQMSMAIHVLGESIDCEVEWSEWSTCSRTCGGGTRSRHDHVIQTASNGGHACPNPPRQQIETCHEHPCEDLCHWTWTDWSECSTDCGTGTRTRKQVIQSPYGVCTFTPQSQVETCSSSHCPTDCQVQWGPWGGCSSSCDGGSQTRTMQIVMSPTHGGTSCPSPLMQESRMCNEIDCDDLGPSCSGFCGHSPPQGECSCDSLCPRYGDCCKDFDVYCANSESMHGSCANRCGTYFEGQCGCDEQCNVHGDCCPDHKLACNNNNINNNNNAFSSTL
jgi:hypothetical protein